MEKLQQRFESLFNRYAEKREYFKQRIEYFLQTKRLAEHQRATHLLNELEGISRDLRSCFLVTAEGAPSYNSLKVKIASFKQCFKEITTLTTPVWKQWIRAIVEVTVIVVVVKHFLFNLYFVPTGSAEPKLLVGDRVWGNKLVYFFHSVQRDDFVIFDNAEFRYDNSSFIQRFWQKYVGVGVPLLGLKPGPDNVVKRVIGLPGDIIEGRLEDGRTCVYVNGKKLDEPYVNALPLIGIRRTIGFIPMKNFGPFIIPGFLQKSVTSPVFYTYDPAKSFDDQPYYSFTESEIVRDSAGKPMMRMPFAPIINYDNYETNYCVDVFGPITVPPGKYWVMGDSRQNSRDSRYWGLLDEKLIHGRISFIIYSIDSEEALWLFELVKHPIDFWTKKVRWSRFFSGFSTFKGSAPQR
jgi:signal peptidase I